MKVIYDRGMFVADGEPVDCAMWAMSIIVAEREMQEKKTRDQVKKQLENLELCKDMTFEELMKKENEEENHD